MPASAATIATVLGEWDRLPRLGPTLRAEHFARGLEAAGVSFSRVSFVSVSGPGEEPQFRFVEHAVGGPRRLGPALPATPVVAAGTYASLAAVVGARAGQPVWADLFGDPLAEALARAERLGESTPVDAAYFLLERILGRADAISVVSRRQRDVAIGQLASHRRLDAATPLERLIATIPCALPARRRGPRPPRSTARALVSGSANSWIDPETLVAALDRAMDEVVHLEVDVTGGGLPGYDEVTYELLCTLVGASPHTERYRLHGWLSEGDLAAVVEAADFGIVPERATLERELGSANRVLDWIADQLPCICSDQSELAGDLASVGGALTYRPGDAQALADSIVRLARDPAERGLLATRAAQHAALACDPIATAAPLVAWSLEVDPPRLPRGSLAGPMSGAAEPSAAPQAWTPWREDARRLLDRTVTSAKLRMAAVLSRFSADERPNLAVAPRRPKPAPSLLPRVALRVLVGVRLLVAGAVVGWRWLRPFSPKPVTGRAAPGRRPRLLIVTPYPLVPAAHGGSVRILGLLRALAEHADLTILSLGRGRDDPAQRRLLESFAERVVTIPHEPGATEGEDLLPPSARPLRNPELRDWIRDLAAEQAVDAVQLEFTELGRYLGAIPGGVPSVLTELDVGFVTAWRRRRAGFHRRFAADGRLWGGLADWLRQLRFEVDACAASDLVHVMSEADARALGRALPANARHLLVVPNAVSLPDRLLPAEGREADLLLFVGFFGHSPNRDAVEWLLDEIWPLIRAARPTARLAIVGGMPPANVAARNGCDGIEVLGQVPEVGSWLERAAVFLAPIRAGSGTRLKILEALAHETPTVSTTLGAEGLHVESGRELLLAEDAASFATSALTLLGDPALGQRLGRTGREHVEAGFTWQRSARIALGGYADLMERFPRQQVPTARVEPPAAADPRVSIVIPTKQGGEALLEVLDAVAAQVCEVPFEIICVDSGSDEAELAAMRERGVRIAHVPPSSFDHGLTRDLGARIARGEVLVFLNQDALPASRYWLALLSEPLLRPGRFDAIQGGIRERPERGGRFYWDSGGQRFYYTRETARWMEEFDGLGFSTVNCAIRRSAWESIHFGWAPIMEDKKWQARARRQQLVIGERQQADVLHSHDWSTAGLWSRCAAEGAGWALLERPYTLTDALADLVHRTTWREWVRALARRRLRTVAELAFPIIRPLALWRGGRRAQRQPPPIRYAPTIEEVGL